MAIQVYQNGGDLQKTKDNFNWTSFGVSVVAGAATGGVATMIEASGMRALAGAATGRAASTAIGAAAGIADTAATNPNATAKDYVKGAGIGTAAGFIGANGATLTSVTTKSASAATITAVTTSAAVSAMPLINPSNGANSKPPPPPPLPAPASSPPPRVHDVIKR